MIWRGVRNWPFVPEAASFERRYSYMFALEVVAVVGGQVQLMDPLDDGAERGAVVDLERRAAEEELAGVGEAGELVQALDSIAGGVEQRVAGEDDEVAPGEARPFAGEDAGVFLVEGREGLVLLGEQAEKEQIGTLLDGIHRIVHAAGPEDVHQPVDLLAKAGGKEIGRHRHGSWVNVYRRTTPDAGAGSGSLSAAGFRCTVLMDRMPHEAWSSLSLPS